MRKNPQVLLHHILESIEWIEKDLANLSADQFYEAPRLKPWYLLSTASQQSCSTDHSELNVPRGKAIHPWINPWFSCFADKNVPIQDAVLRRIEIIGEAVRNLPSDFKQANPKTPWLDIADMRNKLIHEYFDVDLELVWEVTRKDLPPFKEQIKKLILKES